MLIVVEPFTIYNGTKRYKKVSNGWKTKNTYNLGTSGGKNFNIHKHQFILSNDV
jgi:hypothetical protein